MIKLFNNNSNLEQASPLKHIEEQEEKNHILVRKKIGKRTSGFLQKRLSTLSLQPSSFIHNNNHTCMTVNDNRHFSSFSTPTVTTTTTSFINHHNDIAAYQNFKKSYHQFLEIQGLHQEWTNTWKESLDGYLLETIGLSSSRLKFQELIYEVILTEKTYVQDLTLAYQIFAKDALTWHSLPRPLRLIFDNLLQIIRLHLCFLQDLRYRQNNQYPVISTITDIFLNFIPRFLDYYSSYFINFEQANDIIAQSMASNNINNNNLGSYLKARSQWPECRNLTLQSFLLKPIQRLMKYPLFFKSLSETLSTEEPSYNEHVYTLNELESTIRKIEQDKQENEDLRKLQDLVSRITGINENIIETGRHLVYEGYLSLVPSIQAPIVRSITTDTLGSQSYTYTPHPNLPRSRSNSFSLIPSKKTVYIFLFNDVIICTKVRSKTRVKDNYVKLGDYYGPSPDSLFKLILPPGQVTFIDRSVVRLANNNNSKDDSTTYSRKLSSQLSFSRKFSSLRQSRSSSNNSIYHTDYEEHPQQFICSIATQHITNFHFEASTREEKEKWCKVLKNALETHLQRKEWWNSKRKSIPEIKNKQNNNTNHVNHHHHHHRSSHPTYQQTLDIQTKKLNQLNIQQQNDITLTKSRRSTMSTSSSSSSTGSSSNESNSRYYLNAIDETFIPKFTSPFDDPILQQKRIDEIDNWIHPLDEPKVLPSNPLNIHITPSYKH
ncbi:Dbl homology domain-containing protein [Cunninghamella echinulata]|nr:Dbl homology domain-containing protein [Cunninghamella echinulata]